MIFSKIKEYFLRKELEQSPNTNKSIVDNQKIHKIGILTLKESNEVYDFKEKIKKVFPKTRSVHQYIYRSFNKSDEKSYYFFSENDFDWKGKIKDASLQSFVDESFDVLICYFDTNNIFLESLVKQSQSNFKIGFSNVNQSLFDLEISVPIEEVDNFNTEVKKYLQILGGNVS